MKTNPCLQLHCSSPFSLYAEEYIAQKRALGNKCRGEIEIINMFDAYCVEQGIQEPVLTQELYDSWSAKRAHENGNTHRTRNQHLRMFVKFLANNGVEATTVFLPLPKGEKTHIPYIFTHEEVHRFIAAVDRVKPCSHQGRKSLAHLIFPVLFRLLYGCGLRVGEALRLKSKDVDTKSGVLCLHETKGNKERIVPMSATLTQICDKYHTDPLVAECDSEYFFPAPDKLCYAACTVYDRYRQYLFEAGIGHGGRGQGPRLHDLRHTFAVHTLNKWAEEGRDLYVVLPILSAYLGHVDIKSTQKYLQLTSEAHQLVTRPFEEKFGDVFPEVVL